MLEMQLRSASVVAGVGREGEIGAHAVGRGQPRTLADQHHHDLGVQRARDRIAERDAAVAGHDERRDAPVAARRGSAAASSGRAWVSHRARGQAVGDDEGEVVAAPACGGEPRRGVAARAGGRDRAA